jgi:hypothetical protein
MGAPSDKAQSHVVPFSVDLPANGKIRRFGLDWHDECGAEAS